MEEMYEDFINKVKGKKIRCFTWSDDEYFIPNGEYEANGEFNGVYYEKVSVATTVTSTNRSFVISDGLNDNSGMCWYLVDEEITSIKSETNKCTCNMTDLMKYGCRCGGK